MTTTDDSMARYTKSETATFTFIGRAESDTATDLVDKVEECLIGLNLEPQQGWAWIAEGKATAGNFVELLGARIAQVLRTSTDLDHDTRAALAMQLAESIVESRPTSTESNSSRPRSRTPAAEQPGTSGIVPGHRPLTTSRQGPSRAVKYRTLHLDSTLRRVTRHRFTNRKRDLGRGASRKERGMQGQDESRDQASAQTLQPDRLTWSIPEAAQVLGISRASAYEAAHRGELPVRVIGRRMLVPRVALLRLLNEAHTPQPAQH